jgi:hypothetical protein
MPATGEEALASAYVEWTVPLVQVSPAKAERALLRASDYADVSSDISYLLAVARRELNRPRDEILAPLDRALLTDKWEKFSSAQARTLKVKTLLEMKRYDAALSVIATLPASAAMTAAKLWALIQSGSQDAFREAADIALDAYPYYQAIQSLVFRYASRLDAPTDEDRRLAGRALRCFDYDGYERSPVLFDALPFMSDRVAAAGYARAFLATLDEARTPAHVLPLLLEMGVISSDRAMDDLFVPSVVLNVETLRTFYHILGSETERTRFLAKLKTGRVSVGVDDNNDGVWEALCLYEDGKITHYYQDRAQSGKWSLDVAFVDGVAKTAHTHLSDTNDEVDFRYTTYPSVSQASVAASSAGPSTKYFFQPGLFHYAPARFVPLVSGGELYFPEMTYSNAPVIRTLVNLCFRTWSDSMEFPGAVLERWYSPGGVITGDLEILHGVLVGRTIYADGYPVRQFVDTDEDGKLDTERLFRRDEAGGIVIASATPINPYTEF